MRFITGFGVLSAVAVLTLPVVAAAAELRGVTSTEIRIGQTMPYSGPVSAFGPLGKGEVGYFRMLNDRGGINGRAINLISLDDGYAPPKTVEQTRRLVESDEVALIFSSIGTAHNTAIAKYLQGKNIPQLFVGSGASKFAELAQYPQAICRPKIFSKKPTPSRDLELPMLLPGIKINTSPTDHVPIDQMQFMRFNGKTWERFGELQTGN